MADTRIDEQELVTSIALTDYLPFTVVAVDPQDNELKNITFEDFVAAVETELGLGASYQPLDATLTALAGLTIAANTLTIGTGADAFSQTAFAANTFPARASTGNLVAKTVTDYALTLLDDGDAATALLTLGAAPLASPTFTGVPSGPTAAGGTNTTQLATTAFVISTVSSAVTGVLDLQGDLDASANPNYPAASTGHLYYVTVAGKVGGASGKDVEVGDAVICKADNAGGTEAGVGANWFVLQKNLNGALLSANNLSDVASASSARSNLGLAIGTNVQAWSSALDTFAANGSAYYLARGNHTGTQAWSTITGTPSTLAGYGITDAQPLDTDLTSIAALTSAADKVPYATGAGTWALADFTAAGRALLDDANAAAQLTTLGLTANGQSLVTAANYAAMRALLDLEAGTDFYSVAGADAAFQPLDADLTAIAALATDSFGLGVLIKTTAAEVRTYIGAGTSSFDGAFSSLSGVPTTIAGYGITDFNSLGDARWQSLDATLTAFAALTIAANSLTIGTGADAFSQTAFAANTFPARASTGDLVAKAITDFGLSLVDDTDAPSARTTLGLGSLATQSGTFSGTSSGTNTGDQTITLTGDVTGSGTTSFAATIAANAVTLAKFVAATQACFLGATAAGNFVERTYAQVRSDLAVLALAGGTMVGALNMTAGQVYQYNSATAIQAVTGSNDWFFGNSGNLTLSGANNSGFGSGALAALTSGAGNTGIGRSAGAAVTTGNYLVAVGWEAAKALVSGDTNIAIGQQALYGTVTTTMGSNNIAIGTGAMQVGTSGGDNIAIGTNAMGGSAGITNHRNVCIGSYAGRIITSGQANVAIGYTPLYSNTTGGFNVAIGRNSLYYNVSGDANIAVGDYALYQTTGSYGIGVGASAGSNIGSGSYNFSIGYQSMGGGASLITGSRNFAFGYQAGYALAGAASDNVFLGNLCGPNVTTGVENTLLGNGVAGSSSVTTGSGNVFIGYRAGYFSGNVSNELRIGNYNAGQIITGDFSTGRVNIGWVNTATPTHLSTLHLFIKAASDIGLQVQAADSQTGDLTRWLASDGSTILSRVASDGVITAAGYKSSDGSAGATGTATSANTLTIKNGLVTNIA